MIKGLIIGFITLFVVMLGKEVQPARNIEKDQAIIYAVRNALQYTHLSPQVVDENFSVRLFDEYIDRLDPSRRFLTAQDLSEMEGFRNRLHLEFINKEITFFELSNNTIENAILKVKSFYADLLDHPFNLYTDETLELDPKKRSWAKNDEEQREVWRKIFKYEVITRVYDRLEAQKDSIMSDMKTAEEIEKESRERILKRYSDMFERMDRINRNDRFEMYINTFTNLFDPHTEYYSPKNKEDFDIRMQGKLEGIGARLQNDKDLTKIVEVIPGGPAWKDKRLQANDFILRVAQEDSNEFIDLTGMRIDEVVTHIRGKKGTKVKLEVRKPDGTVQLIELVRDEVIIDETKAKSVIVSDSLYGKDIGFIRLPSFYSEFKANGQNSSDDIKTEIEKLKANKVNGIILDLRFNGGGSLPDVITIAGYFIEGGPVVQVKQTNERPFAHRDRSSKALYDGPLVILVNEMSASASEILAAAMQDYNRAIIMGSSATFGKGTVQRFFNLDDMISGSAAIKPLGNVKVTTQKFYRINGESTQLNGMIPDIIMPDRYMFMEIGERQYDNALTWDKLDPLPYNQNVWVINYKDQIINNSNKRIQSDTTMLKVMENAKRLKEYSDKTLVSLNIDVISRESEERKYLNEYFNKYLNNEIPSIIVRNIDSDLEYISIDSSRIVRNDEWLKNIRKDYQLQEAIHVIKDLNELN